MAIWVAFNQLVDLAEDGFPETFPGPVLRLYSNDYTPDGTETVADFAESAAPGYAPQALSAWPTPVFGVDRATYTFDLLTFNFTGAGNIYGYFITDATGLELYWSERRPSAPIPFVAAAGLQYTVLPRISLKTPIA